ncbi:anaphase promoting complex subunit 4 [Mortierella sp. AD094]|nr:anaphase promoting complex subunit 4 [Mortierella sp. AD094]
MARSMFTKNNTQLASGSGSAKDVQALAEKIDEPDEESSDIMNVLFVGDNKGCFKLKLFGDFETDLVSLLELLRSYGVQGFKTIDILKTDIQLDLSELVVIALGSDSNPTTADNEACGPQLLQITITSELLNKYSREIRVLGLKRGPVNHILKYLSDGLQIMQAEFRKINQLALDCVESVQQSLSDNGETTTPSYEFVQLLMTGLPSPSLDTYLQQELRRHGLRRWDKSVKAAYGSIQRVAFECLLPACERLLIHLADILGCSRWDERYKPLKLQEAMIYNCIRIVGDFVGMIERLFLVLKTEMKDFHEFENWLEHVLEILQPTIREADEQGDGGPKSFPPVDYKSVSEFLQSGLANKKLKVFFEDDELEATKSQSHIAKEEEPLLGYSATPSYPIVYSFSEELQRIESAERERLKKETAELTAREPSSTPPVVPKNPFSGAAISAALASRGFGILSQSKLPQPQPTNLFSKSKVPSSTHLLGASKREKPFSAQQRHGAPSSTLERHLQLMTKHCQSIFEGPAEAVAASMKVSHALDLLSSGAANSLTGGCKENSRQLKIATRYCYHDLNPWHYIALYLKRSDKISEPSLCILRSRKKVHQQQSQVARISDTATSTSTADDTTNIVDGRGSPPVTTRLHNTPTMITRLGQKRRASNPDVLNIASSIRARTRSPARTPPLFEAPSLETLSLRSPRREPLTPPPRRIENETGSGNATSPKPDPTLQEFEVAFFSLRERGSNDENSDPLGQVTDLAMAKGQDQGLSGSPPFEIRDVIFLDDDTLGILLSTSTSTSLSASDSDAAATDGGAASHSEQFLVSVPLHSPGRPYHPLTMPQSLSESTSEPLPCLFDILASIPVSVSNRKSRSSRHSTSTPTPLSLYTLPISRFLCVTLPGDPSAPQTDNTLHGAAGSGYNDGKYEKLSSKLMAATIDAVSDSSEMDLGAREQELIGPCRIASNERESRRILSVHRVTSIEEGSSKLQGANQITVFEL